MILPTTEKELDEWKREVVIKHVKRLSGQIGLRHQVPKVIFDLAELDETMKELINKHEVLDWHQNCYGAYFPHIHAVYLNVSSFGKRPSSADRGYIGDLIETIAHELAHARFPGLPHGDEFNKRVRQILNGKRFTWVILSYQKTVRVRLLENKKNLRQKFRTKLLRKHKYNFTPHNTRCLYSKRPNFGMHL